MPFVLNEGIFSSSDSLSVYIFLSSWQGNSDVLWKKQRTVGENVEKCFTLLYSVSHSRAEVARLGEAVCHEPGPWSTLYITLHTDTASLTIATPTMQKNVREKIRKHITYFLQTCKLNPTPVSDMMEFECTFFADCCHFPFLSGYVEKETSKVFSTLLYMNALTQCHSFKEWWESLHIHYSGRSHKKHSVQRSLLIHRTQRKVVLPKIILRVQNKVTRCCLVEISISSCSGSGEKPFKDKKRLLV